MNCVMIYLPTADLEESMGFYEKLGFSVFSDETDGDEKRCVRIIHPTLTNVLFNLNINSFATGQMRQFIAKDLSFAFVSEDCTNWQKALVKADIKIEKKIIEPWGMWIYFRDPSGNLLCVTNKDIW